MEPLSTFETTMLAFGVSFGLSAMLAISFWTARWMLGKWIRR